MSYPRRSTSSTRQTSTSSLPQTNPPAQPAQASLRSRERSSRSSLPRQPSRSTSRPTSRAPSAQRPPAEPTIPSEDESGPDEEEQEEEDEAPPAQAQQQDPPRFEPFFTLVENKTPAGSTVSHPKVHYIFADDDGEVLHEALLRLNSAGQEKDLDVTGKSTETRETNDTRENKNEIRERHIIVTLSADGKTAESAQSLDADWQVTDVEVGAAPTLEGGEGETGGLMLRLQGSEGVREEKPVGGGVLDVEGAIERFRERMDELKRVVEAGQTGQVG